jgi:hypothetical protein
MSDIDEATLAPCPFCATRPGDGVIAVPEARFVECVPCGALGPSADTPTERVAAWNRRADGGRAALLDVRAILADVQDGTPWQVAIDSALLRIEAALAEGGE